jgi:DNA polymerase-3 subunit alpha
MYLVFDTETTGLPRDYNAPMSDVDNWPRLVQLAWQLHDERGKLLSQHNYIIRPEGFTIPYNAEKVHGISTKRALEEGHELKSILGIFEGDVIKAKYLVAGLMAIEVYLSFKSGEGSSVAHLAHVGGGLIGFILVKIWKKDRTNFY